MILTIQRQMNYSCRFCTHFLVILLCVAPLTSTAAIDPVYNGKTLSEWLLLQLRADPSADDAIRQIGTNGIPMLIEILSVKEGNRSKVLRDIKNQDLRDEFHSPYSQLDDLRNLAVNGFGVLGTNAQSALPQLTRLFREDPESMNPVCRALVTIGPEGFSVLTNALNDPDQSVRNNVLWVLGQAYSANPAAITRILTNALNDPYFANRGNAASDLAGKDPSIAVPALTALLDDTEYYPRARAAEALASYGSAAKSAAPKLFEIFTNAVYGTNVKVASDTAILLLNALRSTDPDYAAKAEDFILNGGPLGIVGFGWTTTTLPDGKELIAGGFFQAKAFATTNYVFFRTQLRNPQTGQRFETGDMKTGRAAHRALLLKDGRVLVAGGEDANLRPFNSAEVYDQNTGQWTETGTMNLAHHSNFTLTLMTNGHVLLEQGAYKRDPLSTEEFDPDTLKWTLIKQH